MYSTRFRVLVSVVIRIHTYALHLAYLYFSFLVYVHRDNTTRITITHTFSSTFRLTRGCCFFFFLRYTTPPWLTQWRHERRLLDSFSLRPPCLSPRGTLFFFPFKPDYTSLVPLVRHKFGPTLVDRLSNEGLDEALKSRSSPAWLVIPVMSGSRQCSCLRWGCMWPTSEVTRILILHRSWQVS